MNDKKNILLITDVVGVGNLTTTVMLPILTYMGFPTCSLPTSLVSNNFGYGRYAMLDTSGYLEQTFPIWEDAGFNFSAVMTGFIPTARQTGLIRQFCAGQAAKGAFIFVDPIMADLGEMYHGLPAETVDNMRNMLGVSDLCFPNYTEACYLTGTSYHKEGVSGKEAFEMVDRIRDLGSKSVIITSMKVDGIPAVAGFDIKSGEHFIINYEELPFFFAGTGDIFSAILAGHLLSGEGLQQSTRKAIEGVYKLIELNKDEKDPYNGIAIGKYLDIL